MSRTRQKLVGHEKITSHLAVLRRKGRLPHALLFFGPGGVGKALAARTVAADIMCVDTDSEAFGGCGRCRHCLLLAADTHSDFHWIDAFEPDWGVEHLRDKLAELQLVSFEGGRRLVVLDHAEALGIASFNALLKILEEPRAETYLILVSSSLLKIPITVRSRCALCNFGRLSEAEVIEVLGQQTQVPHAGKVRIAKIVDGTVGDAIKLLEHESFYSDLENDLEAVYDGSSVMACNLAQRLSREKELLRERLNLVRLHAVAHLKRAHCDVKERRVWATCLANVIDAESLIFDRFVTPEQVLVPVFMNLANKSDERIFER
jgi:DNA polymerase III gamma/tau subunit